MFNVGALQEGFYLENKWISLKDRQSDIFIFGVEDQCMLEGMPNFTMLGESYFPLLYLAN